MKLTKSESDIQQLVQAEGARHQCILMRNNSGAFKDINGRLIRFGLGNVSKYSLKSPDLVGFTKVKITPEMVGQTLAVFTAIEVKEEAWTHPKDAHEHSQLEFVEWIRSVGGIASFCNNEAQVKTILGK